VTAITYSWRGEVTDDELHALHAAAFDTRVYTAEEWPWTTLLARHSLGWVVARSSSDDGLVGFVNVVWDGLVHAWLQDTMVAASVGRQGVGTELVRRAADEARAAGCEWLHVDFDAALEPFYIDACGFRPTAAGLLEL
jgi:GNAT superfamily N-acetyltransferase